MPYEEKTLADIFGRDAAWIDPHEFAYFTALSDRDWGRARSCARHSVESLSDTAFADYARSCATVEAAGVIVVRNFLDYYLTGRYKGHFFRGDRDPYEPSFTAFGRTIDVQTRMLRPASGTTGLHCGRFVVMVPELGLRRRADVYVFCGYSVKSRYGLALGFLKSGELADIELTEMVNHRHRAKCVGLLGLHPMTDLVPYLAEESGNDMQ